MNRSKIILILSFLLISALVLIVFTGKKPAVSAVTILNPFDNALYPPEFPAPALEWTVKKRDTSRWEVSLVTRNKKYRVSATTKGYKWTPRESAWDSIKALSDFGKIFFTVTKSGNSDITSRVSFSFCRDTVGAPVLYRQMPIPFVIAEKNLDSMNYMLINFGSNRRPHVAMRGFPVCGNCHSFSADGSTIGLDLDAGLRDKGGYFISPVKDTILFSPANYLSWSKIEKRRTFGLFSKMSPDGRYIVTTVKDRVVIKNFPINPVENIIYSQLFFPVNGHLAIYDRQTNVLKELPGANLDEYVQSNAIWTPDGKNIIFSRAEALPRDSGNIYEINVLDEKLIDQFAKRKKSFRYNLCIIPFNNGNGGTAVPIKGASDNGKSNYFPAVSPDGKWLVFCQADNFMLLMPDSRLFIVPAGGGKARMLNSNLKSMNSWHAWSPNSKWLVFASKGLSPYTDMFLTRIDERGNDAIPVLVDKARAEYRVINYPEFVNRKAGDTFTMEYDYVEIAHIRRALKKGDIQKAKELFGRLENQKPFLFSEDCMELSGMLKTMGLTAKSAEYAEQAKHTINSALFDSK
jgi:WD40-like Beta Propeller Repeat